MVMNQGHTSGFYSIFKLTLALATILPLQGQDTTSVLDTTSVVIKNDTAIVYPGKALIMSLVLPGRGQL